MSKRQLRHELPLPPDPEGRSQLVINSIERLKLESNRFVLVGSAALLMYGVRPPMMHDGAPRPHDVDLTVSRKTFYELLEAGQTPSGVSLAEKEGYSGLRPDMLYAEPISSHLPVDIITSRSYKSLAAHDKGFNKHYQKRSHIIPETAIRVASLDYLVATLKSEESTNPKARSDYGATLRQLHLQADDQTNG